MQTQTLPLRQRFHRLGYVGRGRFSPWYESVAMIPLAILCKSRGWKRDRYGRLVRKVVQSDPPSALFHGSTVIWFDQRLAQGESVICWSYAHATMFDIGAWKEFIAEDKL